MRALAAYNSAEHTRFAILGCTRDASSAKAAALAALPGVTLLETPYEAAALFAKAQQHGQRIDGVFSVQLSADTTFEAEVALGCAMADEAAKAHVGLFVYASVQRGDVDKTGASVCQCAVRRLLIDPMLDIVHFESKRAIEQYIADKHPALPCAILRPVFFAVRVALLFIPQQLTLCCTGQSRRLRLLLEALCGRAQRMRQASTAARGVSRHRHRRCKGLCCAAGVARQDTGAGGRRAERQGDGGAGAKRMWSPQEPVADAIAPLAVQAGQGHRPAEHEFLPRSRPRQECGAAAHHVQRESNVLHSA